MVHTHQFTQTPT